MTPRAKQAVRPRTNSQHRRDGLVGIVIRDFPLDLKRKIAKAAEAEGTNSQDIVVIALAAAYGVKYEPGGRKTATGRMGDSTQMHFAMPRALRRKINLDAARREVPTRSIVLALLTEKFGRKR